MTSSAFQALLKNLKYEYHPAGTCMTKFGHTGNKFFVMLKGKCSTIIPREDKRYNMIAQKYMDKFEDKNMFDINQSEHDLDLSSENSESTDSQNLFESKVFKEKNAININLNVSINIQEISKSPDIEEKDTENFDLNTKKNNLQVDIKSNTDFIEPKNDNTMQQSSIYNNKEDQYSQHKICSINQSEHKNDLVNEIDNDLVDLKIFTATLFIEKFLFCKAFKKLIAVKTFPKKRKGLKNLFISEEDRIKTLKTDEDLKLDNKDCHMVNHISKNNFIEVERDLNKLNK